jgi:hypothetical protein
MKVKLSYEQFEAIKKKAVNQRGFDTWVDSKPKPVKYWSLDDLAKGKMFSPSFLKKCITNAVRRRQQHRHAGNRGWTWDKKMRSEVRIPTELYLQPEFQKKYFPEGADEHEKAKALEALKRDYPVFCTHD